MSAKIGSLHVSLGLDSAQFQTGLEKSNKKLDTFAKDGKNAGGIVGKAFAGMTAAVGTFGKTLALSIGGGLVAGGIAGIVTRMGQVASAVASIGDEAKRSGLGVEAFQELRYVAEQNRVSLSALTDGMKELSLRADEFIVTGGGAGAEAFQRLGFSAEELNEKLQNPSALFTEIIGKLQGLDRAAQIRISDELFGGTGGEQFVQLIGQGEEGIRRTIAEAHGLGIIMSEELVAKAAEVDRKFNMVANTVGSALKGAIVEAASALNDFLNTLGQTPAQHFGEVNGRIAEQVQLIHDLGAAGGREFPELGARLAELVGGLDATGNGAIEAQAALLELAANPDYAPLIGDLNGVISVLLQLTGQAREAAAAIAAANSDPTGAGATWEGMQGTFFPKPTTKPGTGGSGGSGISDAQREADAIKNLIAGLEFERSLIGLTAVQQAKLNALRQAGAAATEEQRIQIGNLVEATHREQEAAQLATDQMQALSDIGVSAAQSLADAFADGKIEGSELLTIVTDIVKQLLTMPTGGGGGGNWLGSIFSSLLGGLGGGGGLQLGFNGGVQVPAFACGGSMKVGDK